MMLHVHFIITALRKFSALWRTFSAWLTRVLRAFWSCIRRRSKLRESMRRPATFLWFPFVAALKTDTCRLIPWISMNHEPCFVFFVVEYSELGNLDLFESLHESWRPCFCSLSKQHGIRSYRDRRTHRYSPLCPKFYLPKCPGREDPRAEARIVSVKQLVMRVTQVNDELQTLRNESLTARGTGRLGVIRLHNYSGFKNVDVPLQRHATTKFEERYMPEHGVTEPLNRIADGLLPSPNIPLADGQRFKVIMPYASIRHQMKIMLPDSPHWNPSP